MKVCGGRPAPRARSPILERAAAVEAEPCARDGTTHPSPDPVVFLGRPRTRALCWQLSAPLPTSQSTIIVPIFELQQAACPPRPPSRPHRVPSHPAPLLSAPRARGEDTLRAWPCPCPRPPAVPSPGARGKAEMIVARGQCAPEHPEKKIKRKKKRKTAGAAVYGVAPGDDLGEIGAPPCPSRNLFVGAQPVAAARPREKTARTPTSPRLRDRRACPAPVL